MAEKQIKERPQTETGVKNGRVRSVLKPYIPVVVSIIALATLGRILTHGFLTFHNINNILSSVAILAIAGFGQTLVIISGNNGYDMSVGAMMTIGAITSSVLANSLSGGFWLALAVLVVFGMLVGFIHAQAILRLNVPPLIVTLAMSTVLVGLIYAITKGRFQSNITPVLMTIGTGYVANIRILAIVGIIVLVLGELFLRKSRFGKSLYLLGSNRNAAVLAGINTKRVYCLTYMFAGAASAIAGVLCLAYSGTARYGMGDSYTLLTVASVVVGGTSLSGGKGSYIGTYLGAILFVILSTVLVAVGMDSNVRSMIQGLILLLILIVYYISAKEKS